MARYRVKLKVTLIVNTDSDDLEEVRSIAEEKIWRNCEKAAEFVEATTVNKCNCLYVK